MLQETDQMPANLRSVFVACGKHERVTLVLKGMRPARQTSRFLAGRGSPKGEIVADGEGNSQLVAFKSVDMLAWMVARGFARRVEE